MTQALRASALSKRYVDRAVLEALDLEVEHGGVVALIGPNGVGKSTLIGCVCGTVIPDAGTIEIDGVDLHAEPLKARAALRYLPQEIEVPPGLTGAELLQFWADVYGDPNGIAAAIDWLPFAHSIDHLATTYSVGMRRQLAFAGMMFGAAGLFVLDEPLAGIDIEGRNRMLEFLRARAGAGAGIMLSAHDAEAPEVAALGARVVQLKSPGVAPTP